jgi:hypothetical protein
MNNPFELNERVKKKPKVYLTEDYDMFGSGCEKHKKYLPCVTTLVRLDGDSFYSFNIEKDGKKIRSCGYANGMELIK